jgi:uncharacterized protein (TIGR02265 family)
MPSPARSASPYEGQLVFSQGVEVLLNKAHADRLTPQCKQRIREAGIDLDAKLLPAYPRATYLAAQAVLAEELYPGPLPEAFRAMGERFFQFYLHTGAGKAAGVVIKLLGPRRTMLRTSHFRQSDNFTSATAVEVSPTRVDVIHRGCGPYPQFLQGVYLEVVRACGGLEPTAEIQKHDGVDLCTYEIGWKTAT